MPRGKHNKHNNYRGRGGGHGRGRGGIPATGTTAPAGRPPRNLYPNPNAEIDAVVQQWAEPDVAVGGNGNGNRGSGPWRGGAPKSRSGAGTHLRGVDSPWRGDSTPRGTGSGRGRGQGRGRGRGRGWDNGGDASRGPRLGVGVGPKARTVTGKGALLSDLLKRPLWRPVKFVQATLTPFLFQHSEEVLQPASDIADTTETSHVPTADRVARLFHENVSDSDSESEGHAHEDALEEIDFADLAQVRAEVDAIAQGTFTMDQDVHNAQQDIEEVDFADLAVIRAQVDSAEPQAASRDDVLEEAFTGVYNQVKDMMEVSSTMDDVQQRELLSTSPTPDDSLALKPSIEISNQSNHKSLSQARDTIVIEEEVPCSSNEISDVPALSTAPETHSVSVLFDDLSPPPDALEHDDPHPLFIIDTAPTPSFTNRSASDVILVERTGHGETLGDQDEERIVYVAPHPRSGCASPVPVVPRVKLPHSSMLTGRRWLTSPIREDNDDAEQESTTAKVEAGEDHHLSLAALSLDPATAASLAAHPTHTKTALRARKKEVGLRRERQRQGKRGRMGFGAFGAMVSEARLREEDVKERRHPKWQTRRRGDSDLDWGTEDEDEDEDEGEDGVEEDIGVDAVSNGLGGMEIDPDLDLDVNAMQGFLKSMSAEGSRFVTMDDIEDEAQMRQEDEEGQGGPEGSSNSEHSDDEEDVFNIEEEILIAESEGEEELSPDSDDELSPRSNFQARLRKVRERSRNQHPDTVQEISDDEEDAPEIMPWTRSANDEEFIARINDILEENSHVPSGRDRKQKKALFRNLHQGYVDARDVEMLLDDPEFTTPVQKKKKKAKGKQPTVMFAAELQAQWDKDRAKKAELKRERERARLRAALDPLSAENGKGKGKGGGGASRKAMHAAARLDPTTALAIAPHAIVDTVSLEAQMRRFVADVKVGRRTSMALPPMNKETRKMVHEMASVFGVKSVSKGKGNKRYTTLVKTSQTGWGVKEDRVSALMNRYGGGGKGGRIPRHREGDEVGKEAPKIEESNIGFRMLASMGWSEGGRIGGTASVGIEAPLTAIIKNSKLGLGATR